MGECYGVSPKDSSVRPGPRRVIVSREAGPYFRFEDWYQRLRETPDVSFTIDFPGSIEFEGRRVKTKTRTRGWEEGRTLRLGVGGCDCQ